MGAPLITEEPYASSGTVPVYDADAHIAEPTSVWQEYTDPKYRDLVLQCRPVGDADSVFVEDQSMDTSAAPACIPNAYGTRQTTEPADHPGKQVKDDPDNNKENRCNNKPASHPV